MKTSIVKLEIEEKSIYFIYGNRFVDITIARHGGKATAEDELLDEARRLHDDNVRALIDAVCCHARTLLEKEEWTLKDVAEAWSMVRSEPAGVCKKLKKIVKGPLDAAAWYLKEKVLKNELTPSLSKWLAIELEE